MAKKTVDHVAYHEAGHAVMYFVHYRKFPYVTIIPDDRSLGCLDGYKMHPKTVLKLELNMTFDAAIEDVMCSLAGGLAEEKFVGKKVRSGLERDNDAMVEFVSRLMTDLDEQDAFYK